ncbi:sulfotransferase [Marimonas lutisalis]|uniref:sulfotransferase n=1 Tax=Marimonas lutisalis TaxID=2545756 RepID=UPI0010F4375E|nr:sulfotransferase [Marimonas lutisalis]
MSGLRNLRLLKTLPGKSRDRAEPAVFLCIGAQKAGTTWLADNLKGHEDLLIAKRKEVHYFDVLDGQSPSTFRRAQRRVTSLLKKLPPRPGPNFDAAMEEIDSAYANLNIYRGGWHDHEPYFDYLREGYGGQRYVCDFTPAYSTLSEMGFSRMAAALPGAKYLFVLRDPLDRHWSSMRMSAFRRAKDADEGKALVLEEARKFAANSAESVPLRSDYARTIGELERVAPRENIHYEFFETLFTSDAIARVCRFLGVAPVEAAFEEKSREGTPVRLPEDCAAGFLRRLAGQYEFCAEKFGGALPERWQARIAQLKEAAID